jgi:hypothetical protein
MSVWVVLRNAPPLPFLPEDVHGTEVIVMATFYVGDAARGEELIAPIKDFGTPVGTHLGAMP